ncbi:MAG TPA: Smr/MutS family protein [Solimonas sp.]|nr:Smr/MutS family protein [Solimonas sp.]
MSRPPLSDDDIALFRDAVQDVQRKAPSEHITRDGRRLSTRPRSREADDREVMQELLADPPELFESGDTLSYRSDGIQDAVLRKLRRGQYHIQRELDLHGLNRNHAHAEVSQFLALCRDQDLRCVRVIHGKGNGSPNSGPVIKTLLDGWLRKRREVLAFCSARPVDGGTGAVYVLLRRGGAGA